MAKNTGNMAAMMRAFRREIRNHANKPILLHAADGYGASLFAAFSKFARGERLYDEEIQEVLSPCGDNLLSEQATEPAAGDDDDQPRGRRVSIVGGPTIVPGGPGGKAVAILPVRGVALYALEFQPYCFSTLKLGQDITGLANDPEIGTIILDIDTPGGAVTGTAEAANAIWKARQRKRVVAFVNPLCASAGYWLASQASEIISIPSADIGSVGVYMAHTDCSKFNEMQGMKVTYIHFGKYKVEGNMDEPLSEEGRAYYQLEVDAIGRDFHKAVARGRGVSVEEVAENFGQGRCMAAPMAKKFGLIDNFMTISEALSHCGVPTARQQRSRHGEVAQPAPVAELVSVEADGEALSSGSWAAALPEQNVSEAESVAEETVAPAVENGGNGDDAPPVDVAAAAEEPSQDPSGQSEADILRAQVAELQARLAEIGPANPAGVLGSPSAIGVASEIPVSQDERVIEDVAAQDAQQRQARMRQLALAHARARAVR